MYGFMRGGKVMKLNNKCKWIIIETITTACLFWLPVNLLNLYYAGGWIEPNQVILVAELAVLYSLPAFAVWRFEMILRESVKRYPIDKRIITWGLPK